MASGLVKEFDFGCAVDLVRTDVCGSIFGGQLKLRTSDDCELMTFCCPDKLADAYISYHQKPSHAAFQLLIDGIPWWFHWLLSGP